MNNENQSTTIYPSRRRRRTRWWIPLTIIVAVIAIIFFAICGIIAYIGSQFESLNGGYDASTVVVQDNTILKLDFGWVSEVQAAENPFTLFSANNKAPKPTFYELIEGINAAATDPKIIGIYYEGNSYLSGAMQKDLQLALTNFKKSGKFIYSYLEASTKNQYVIASISDSIFVPDEGMYEISGFGITNVFMKGLYDKIGLEFAVVQCEDFKTVAETYKNKKFSDSSRLAYKVLLADRENEFIKAVANNRKITPEQVMEYMGKGIIDSDEMIELCLADAKGTKIDVMDILNSKVFIAGGSKGKKDSAGNTTVTTIKKNVDDFEDKDDLDGHLVSINSYIAHLSLMNNQEDYLADKDRIAIICGEGPIVSSATTSPYSFSKESQIVSSDFSKLIREAAENVAVKGIILRINSPGGSVMASEEIYQAIQYAKTMHKKPIYCSMSDVAASGGYYIAMACDTIIAHPQTITGSIGVVAAFPNASKLIDNLYMSVDTISNGVGKPFFLNPELPLNLADVAVFDSMIHRTYKRFVTKAAASRNMSFDDLRASAKGRVWLGKDAYDRHLVDTLGNLQTAISMMKERIGSENIVLNFRPKKENAFSQFMKIFNSDAISGLYGMLIKSKELALLENALQLTPSLREQLSYQQTLSAIATKERVLMALPMKIDIK